jgi:hypothetical protein
LNRVRVLELVDKDPLEPVLKVSARIVILQQSARAKQQVAKIELSRRPLGILVEVHQFPQFVTQRGGEIRFCRRLESLDLKREAAPPVEEARCGHAIMISALAQVGRSFMSTTTNGGVKLKRV